MSKDLNKLTDFKIAYFRSLEGKDGYIFKLNKEREELVKAVSLFKTPSEWIKKREGKAGQVFEYVPGGLVKRALNLLFGLAWSWDFEVLEWTIENAAVKGVIEVYTPNYLVRRSDIGGKENQKSKRTGEWIHSKNDVLKAAVTDAEKRCAAQYGLFLDLWIKDEQRSVEEVENQLREMTAVEFIRNYMGMVLNLDPKEHRDKLNAVKDLLSIMADVDVGNATIYLGYQKLLEAKLSGKEIRPKENKELVKKETK